MKRPRILWIEDDERLEMHVNLLRNKYGYDVVWDRTPGEGEEHIRGNSHFDLFLVDFEFVGTDKNGTDLVQLIRDNKHRQNSHIVLLSIKVVASGEYKILDGGTHCLWKPISAKDLAAAIGAILNGEDVRSALLR